ncbi:hypothetical protein C7S18_14755 [Ahniella affigens]|uniref:Uncharacterized protein n=1 Tax=Ahniella affigens TaxID=2021234 RepID=A0A2P1PU52_9GAMM|nr:hypothetical protein [Ahniella affigens]AVP98368.1 hypothetical protein C7S18_14755 [Ahniella affigens]
MTEPILHPEWRARRLHAQNRWQQRRQLWPQTVVFGLLSAFVIVAAVLWLRQLLVPELESIWRYWQARPAGVAIIVLMLSWFTTRASLQRAEIEAQSGPYAALPVSGRTTERWRNHLVWQRQGWQTVLLLAVAWLLHAADVGAAMQATLLVTALVALSVGNLAARLSIRPPSLAEATREHAPRAVGRPWLWLSHPLLPHVPAFQVQFGQKLWWAGRARWGLFVLLLISPRDLLSVLIPIVGMAIWYGASQLEAMHRSLFAMQALLAWCPLPGTRVLRAAWRAPALLLIGLLGLLCAVLLSVRAPWPMVVAVALLLIVLTIIDLLWCVRFRRDAARAQRVRVVSMALVLVMLQQWPMGLLPLLLWLSWRATRGLHA